MGAQVRAPTGRVVHESRRASVRRYLPCVRSVLTRSEAGRSHRSASSGKRTHATAAQNAATATRLRSRPHGNRADPGQGEGEDHVSRTVGDGKRDEPAEPQQAGRQSWQRIPRRSAPTWLIPPVLVRSDRDRTASTGRRRSCLRPSPGPAVRVVALRVAIVSRDGRPCSYLKMTVLSLSAEAISPWGSLLARSLQNKRMAWASAVRPGGRMRGIEVPDATVIVPGTPQTTGRSRFASWSRNRPWRARKGAKAL
jgi:hypothetical protein